MKGKGDKKNERSVIFECRLSYFWPAELQKFEDSSCEDFSGLMSGPKVFAAVSWFFVAAGLVVGIILFRPADENKVRFAVIGVALAGLGLAGVIYSMARLRAGMTLKEDYEGDQNLMVKLKDQVRLQMKFYGGFTGGNRVRDGIFSSMIGCCKPVEIYGEGEVQLEVDGKKVEAAVAE